MSSYRRSLGRVVDLLRTLNMGVHAALGQLLPLRGYAGKL